MSANDPKRTLGNRIDLANATSAARRLAGTTQLIRSLHLAQRIPQDIASATMLDYSMRIPVQSFDPKRRSTK